MLDYLVTFSGPAPFKSCIVLGLLALGALFCWSFLCSFDQPCKTLQTVLVDILLWGAKPRANVAFKLMYKPNGDVSLPRSRCVSRHATLLHTRLCMWGGALRDETKNGCEGDYGNVSLKSSSRPCDVT